MIEVPQVIVSQKEILGLLRKHFDQPKGDLSHIDGGRGEFVEFTWSEPVGKAKQE